MMVNFCEKWRLNYKIVVYIMKGRRVIRGPFGRCFLLCKLDVKKVLKMVIREFLHMTLNHIINEIPSWHIRKIFYLLCGMKIGKGTRICMRCSVLAP